MTTRRKLLLTASAVAATAGILKPRDVLAADTMADFLFVQTADAMSFDKATSKLTLEGVSAQRRCSSRIGPNGSPAT